MRISDWSSDVCSSDLHQPFEPRHRGHQRLARKFEFAAIMRRKAHQSIGEGMDAFVDQALKRRESACGLGHFSAAFDEEIVVHPPVGTGLCTVAMRSEEHTSELQSLMRISYAVFCLKKK